MVAAQVIKSMNQQDDEDAYEPKSVRQIKDMFNKPSKPPVPGRTKLPLVSVTCTREYRPI